jgi:hypothetical protein
MKIFHFCMMLIVMYVFYCVDIAFLYDVSYNVHTMFCGYCEITKDYNLECQTLMRVMHFYLLLILVYVLYYAAIVRQQNITFLNPKPQWKYWIFAWCTILMYVLCCASIARQHKIITWTLNHNEGITLLHDVSYSVHTLLCGYYEAIKDLNIVWESLGYCITWYMVHATWVLQNHNHIQIGILWT